MRNDIFISETYLSNGSLYLGINVTRGELSPGSIIVRSDNIDNAFIGQLSKNGTVSGLSKMYRALKIKPGVSVEYKAISDSEIILNFDFSCDNASDNASLNWCHFEPFRVTNFEHWNPTGENDILVAFGALMQFTEYEYCRYTAKDDLHKIGYFDLDQRYNPNKPDAIVFNKKTREYLIAEFKIKSSLFKSNHKPNDVAVLFVWEDDEKDRTHLPATVISLKDLAKSTLRNTLN